jgi:predicted nucleic acid-binding protein
LTECVLDASSFLAWLLPDEDCPALDRLFDSYPLPVLHVPALWDYETANGLYCAYIRKRLTDTELTGCLQFIKTAPEIRRHMPEHLSAYVHNAKTYGLSLYDATYLTLAKNLNRPLITLDHKLAAAAEKAGLKPVDA